MVPIFNPHVAESPLNSTLIIATETEQKQNEIDRNGRFLGENRAFFTAISRSAGQKPGLWLAYATAHATMGHIQFGQIVRKQPIALSHAISSQVKTRSLRVSPVVIPGPDRFCTGRARLFRDGRTNFEPFVG